MIGPSETNAPAPEAGKSSGTVVGHLTTDSNLRRVFLDGMMPLLSPIPQPVVVNGEVKVAFIALLGDEPVRERMIALIIEIRGAERAAVVAGLESDGWRLAISPSHVSVVSCALRLFT